MHIDTLTIRPAAAAECQVLARLAVEDRSHWRLGVEELQALHDELRMDTPAGHERPTFVAEVDGGVAGFYRLNMRAVPLLLERFWVRPAPASALVGRELLRHAAAEAARRGFERLVIGARARAACFYRDAPLLGAEESVAGIPETGDDVAMLVQLTVDRRHVHRHVGV